MGWKATKSVRDRYQQRTDNLILLLDLLDCLNWRFVSFQEWKSILSRSKFIRGYISYRFMTTTLQLCAQELHKAVFLSSLGGDIGFFLPQDPAHDHSLWVIGSPDVLIPNALWEWVQMPLSHLPHERNEEAGRVIRFKVQLACVLERTDQTGWIGKKRERLLIRNSTLESNQRLVCEWRREIPSRQDWANGREERKVL